MKLMNSMCLSIALLLSAPAMASAACIPPPVTPTGWWPGDGSGDDYIGNRDASLINGAAFGPGFVRSSAFQFDGVDDYASIADDAVFDPGTGDITVNFWVNPTAGDDEMVMVEKFNESDGSTGWSLSRRFGNIYYAGGSGDLQTADPIPLGVWTHIAMRRSGGTVTLFKNGALVASAAITADFDNPHEILIGRRRGPQGFFWNGLIDEIQLHAGTALSDSEILAIHAAGSDGQCTTCGNGVPDPGEDCDDGNFADGDGCDGNCKITACGNGALSPSTGEVCDDGNLVEGDGCDSNCTVTACGNGALSPSTGETCDDGNLDNGDGCEDDCGYTPVNVVLPPGGGTVTTDPMGNGATPEIPTQVALSTTSGGTITIDSTTETVTVDGVQFIGVAVEITAPGGTPESPLEITLVIDPSVLPPSIDTSQLNVVRDATPLRDCLSPTVADPDPCLRSLQVLPSGDLEFITLSSHASRWQVAVRGQSVEERNCVNAMNAAGLKVAKAQAKASTGCLKAAAKGEQSDPQACLTADEGGKVAAVMDKTSATQTGKCLVVPPFGFTGSAAVNTAAQSALIASVADLFGPNLNTSLIGSGDTAGVACQTATLGSLQKLFTAKAGAFLKCKKSGLAGEGGLMISGVDLAGCFDVVAADVDGKIEKASDKLERIVATKCAGPGTAFPGPCSLSTPFVGCLEARTTCRLCQMFSAMDDLDADCDELDDDLGNGSCF